MTSQDCIDSAVECYKAAMAAPDSAEYSALIVLTRLFVDLSRTRERRRRRRADDLQAQYELLACRKLDLLAQRVAAI